jgi:cell wall-associated protease
MTLRTGSLVFLFVFAVSSVSFAQEIELVTSPQDWFLRDPEGDHLQGISAEKTYLTLLQGQPSREILVAVIDSGIDIDHEDLKSIIWTNKNEIPANGIDDDKNGYVDDVHGWNFIGGKNGNVAADTYELTREYVRLKNKFENTEERKIGKKQRAEYQLYKEIKEKFEKLRESNSAEYSMYSKIYLNAKMSMDTLKAVMHTDTLTQAQLEQFTSNDPILLFAKSFVLISIKMQVLI